MVVFLLVFLILFLLNLWVCSFNYIEALMGTAAQLLVVGCAFMLLQCSLESAIKKEAGQASTAISAPAPRNAE